MTMKKYIFFISILLLALGCNQIQKAKDVITNPTAREVYERDFEKNDSLLIRWKLAFERSKNDSIQITLPYSESGLFSEDNFNVYSYDLQLKEGQQLIVDVDKSMDSTSVFIALFKKENDSVKSIKLLKSSDPGSTILIYEPQEYGFYKITVQPEMRLQFPFQLKIYTQPLYGFPVKGGTNKNVQSFWADPRDGGGRPHEGVDIFAVKGTPVVAITDGRISSTGNRGLGGKQVWLRDGLFGKTMYYAHLDSIATADGQLVKQGDTLGFVGNTGNARTTAPHLHFGIYKGKTGAIDPFPFIKMTEIQEIESNNTVTEAIVNRNRTDLYKGPAGGFKTFASLSKNDTVSILGKNRQWFHVVTKDSLKGFINESRLEPLPPN